MNTLEFEQKSTPIISIGMPVYNGEKHVREALDSLLAQTFGNFELIISDNYSTDNTEKICREYAARDKRIRYIRQKENMGAHNNFMFVLHESRGEYFMWAACDDIRSRDFIEVNFLFLKNNPDYVASISPVRFTMSEPDPVRMGDASLDADYAEKRVINFFRCWHANGRFYSLFYKNALLVNIVNFHEEYFGGDWAIVLDLANRGKFKRLDIGELVLGKDGVSNSANIFRLYRKCYLDWLIPFRRLSYFLYVLSKKYSIHTKIILIRKILFLNLIAMRQQVKKEFITMKRLVK